ncbi:MAG TPA: TRAM domain-containing protein [Rhabdochlamydiaceae bacterium]
MTLFMLSSPTGSAHTNALIGIVLGLAFSLLLVGFDMTFKRFNLRSFNIAIVGIFIGYLMGEALVLVLNAVLEISRISIVLQPQTLEIIKISLFLFGTYLGTIMTLRAADELYVSIPFVKFAPTAQKKKDLIIDSSVLSDARIIDVAATGLFDHQIIVPRFIVKDLYAQAEIGDEFTKMKARRSLDVIKKLETITELEIKVNDTDFPDVKDIQGKLVRLARLLDANLLTADISRVQMSFIEGIRIINMHSLSNALKPLMQAGEYIKIKIQRYGKEPRQGVGYLDDGTMVVVNGGGNYIGETIDAKVLSVKHTTSGRMIFCNARDDDGETYTDEHEHLDDER